MSIDTAFSKYTRLWISIADPLIDSPSLEEDLVRLGKTRVAKTVFEALYGLCRDFIAVVTGDRQSHISEGVCYNRLLKENRIQGLADPTRKKTKRLLRESFYLGVMTHLYVFTFPTRDRIPTLDLESIRAKWELESIAPSHVLGQLDRLITDIGESHFASSVAPFIKQAFGVGMFAMGKHRAFFRELFHAGILLCMKCDLATKQ